MIFEKFEAVQHKREIVASTDLLMNTEPRSLIFGQTDDRYFMHVYLDVDQVIKQVVYDQDGLLVSAIVQPGDLSLADCIPSLKVYPDKCDFEFCEVLLAHRVFLPFTMYSWIDQEQWFGLKVEDTNTSLAPADFCMSFDISYSDLGLDRRKLSKCTELETWLSFTFNKQMTGFLRSLILRNENEADHWFYCIGVLFENRVSNHYSVELPSDFGTRVAKLCEKAKRESVQRLKQMSTCVVA